MADEILKAYEMDLEKLSITPSDGGRFEVLLDGQAIFSKKQLGRHANPGEVMTLLRERLPGMAG